MSNASFAVYGTPMPQGSKKAFNANGRAMMKEAGGLKHAAWRNAVADAAHTAMLDQCDGAPLDTALAAIVAFRFPMPKSRGKHLLTIGSAWRTVAPDIDKLCRAVFDGLQAGGLIVNDSNIVSVVATKLEVVDSWTGAHITISDAWPLA